MPIGPSGVSSGGATVQGFEIGYDQITSPVNIASTTEATGTTIITCGAHTFDGAAVLATFFAPYIENGTAAAASVTVCLFESSTQITRLCTLVLASGTLQEAYSPCAVYRFTPTAGSHTYTVTAFANSTTGTPSVGAGAGGTAAHAPAFIRFTKV